ncbi:MAG TPA: hypothetical protein VK466_09255, partial [Terriglobales bacterium]|nr:hypothetical protein [Terriglobales bacterium]
MATTIQPPETEQRDESLHTNGGRGGHLGNFLPAEGSLKLAGDYSPEPSRTGIWIGLAAITMSFAAFTSALVVRQAT